MIKLENKIVITPEDKEFELVSRIIKLVNSILYGEIRIQITNGTDLSLSYLKSEKLKLKDRFDN
jgi:hypothetical protein